MKLFAASLSLMATELAMAQKYQTYIPYDCYRESDKLYGDKTDAKVSDMEAMTGLDAYRHRIIAITGCVDSRTTLISGLTTVWGMWDGGSSYTDVQRLNVVGRLSGLYEFPDNDALSNEGLSSLDDGQLLALQHYWYQEASPDQE